MERMVASVKTMMPIPHVEKIAVVTVHKGDVNNSSEEYAQSVDLQ
jgi:hypothetical protein